jgi:hypothetical protein
MDALSFESGLRGAFKRMLVSNILVFAHYLCGVQSNSTPQSSIKGANREANIDCACCYMAGVGLLYQPSGRR